MMNIRLAVNRRQSSRALVAFAVKQVIGNTTILFQASDISSEGLLVACVLERFFREEARCRLEFTLPGTEVLITALGRVVRQEVQGRYHLCGIRFAALAPSHRRLISRYVKSPLLEPPAAPPFHPALACTSALPSR